MAKQPNIILIMTDEMRGDCMGCAGHPDVKTPYIDSLANHGVLFPNAYSACPTCVPARAVLHTGLSQRHTGRVGYQDRVDWDYPVTLAGEMRKAGYYAQCVGKMHVHPLRSYLGFDHVDLHDGYLHEYRYPGVARSESQWEADDYFHWLRQEKGVECDVTDTGLDCNSYLARPWIYEEKYHPTNWVTSRCIDFLRRRDPRQPFFLMASYVRPHAPYDAPQAYFDLYKDKQLRMPVTGDWDDVALKKQIGSMYNSTTGPDDMELVRQMLVGYYACITHVDHQIGRLLLALVENQVMDDSIILFTSDHGEMLGDHSMVRKGRPWQGSVHIPMIISGPENVVGTWGSKRDDLVELRDVMPTLLSCTSSPLPNRLDGQSMLAPIDRQLLHCEHTFGQMSFQMMLSAHDKYIWYEETGKEQYFDLASDPGETHNAICDENCQPRIRQLRQALIAELAGCEEGFSDGKQLIPGLKPRNLLKSVLGEKAEM